MKNVIAFALLAITAGLVSCEVATQTGIRGIPDGIKALVNTAQSRDLEQRFASVGIEAADVQARIAHAVADTRAKVAEVAERAVEAAQPDRSALVSPSTEVGQTDTPSPTPSPDAAVTPEVPSAPEDSAQQPVAEAPSNEAAPAAPAEAAHQDHAEPHVAETPVVAKPVEEPAPVSLGGKGTTSYYGFANKPDADQPWAAAAQANPDYDATAPSPAAPVATEAPAQDTAAEAQPAPAPQPVPAEQAVVAEAPAPPSKPTGQTSFYGKASMPDADRPWAAEAQMNPDYVQAAAAPQPVDEPAAAAQPDSAPATPQEPPAVAQPDPAPPAAPAVAETAPPPTPTPEPASEPEAQSSSEPEAQSSSEPEAQSSSEPEAQPSSEPEAQPSSEPEAQPSSEPEAQSAPEATPAPAQAPAAATPPVKDAEPAAADKEADAAPPPAEEAKPVDAASEKAAPADAQTAAPSAAADKAQDVSPAVQQAIEACRDALNAEADIGELRFRLTRWNISPDKYKALDNIAKIAKDCGEVVIEVRGHTDSTGRPASNQTLSNLRAKAVIRYLTKAGVAPSKLKAVGLGQGQPVAKNTTAAGRRLNRRIEFLVTGG